MFLNFQNFNIHFLRLILYIQILMYRNLDFLVRLATIDGVLLVSASMLLFFFFSSKNQLFLDEKNNNDPNPEVCTET